MAYYFIENGRGEVIAKLRTKELGRYTLLNADGSELPPLNLANVRVNCLGAGGFGAVVLARDRAQIKRVIKIIHPGEIAPASRSSDDPFIREVQATNQTPYKNVIPIIDYESKFPYTDPDIDPLSPGSTKELGYYVSAYVSGTTLADFVSTHFLSRDGLARLSTEEGRRTFHDLLLLFLDDILAGLVELHEARVVHMDVKPHNIMVQHAVRPAHVGEDGARDRCFIIDLGAAKHMTDETPGRTFCIFTPAFFPRHEIGSELELGKGHGCERSKLAKWWKHIDLFCVGTSVKWLFRNHPMELNKILGDDAEVFHRLVNRLTAITDEGRRFRDATDARLSFRAINQFGLRSILSAPSLIDEHAGMRIRAGNELVRLSKPLDAVIDHPMFQRLKRLQQLSLVSEIYPGGTHTRFEHSLQTFNLAKKACFCLQRNIEFRLLCGRRDVELLLAAALLHDVGQYHFSHTIEDLRKMADLPFRQSKDCEVLRGIRHDQEVARVMLEYEMPGHQSISGILTDAGYSVEDIIYLIAKDKKDQTRGDKLNLLRDLISGTIDLDRVSYLVTDSTRTGAQFGGCVDIGVLLDTLTVKPRGIPDVDSPISLAIEELGASQAEALILAVYWMYRNVYWHHMNRGFMAAVKFVIRRLLCSGQLSFEAYVKQLIGRSDWEALRLLSVQYKRLLISEGEKHSHNPLEGIYRLERLGYRRVLSLTMSDTQQSKLYQRLVQSVMPELEDAIAFEILHAVLGDSKAKSRRAEVLLDIPLKGRLSPAERKARSDKSGSLATGGGGRLDTRAEEGARSPVWVCLRDPNDRGNRRWRRLDDYSYIARPDVAGRAEEESARRIRVFLSRKLYNELSPLLKGSLGDIIVGILEHMTPTARECGLED